MPLKRYLLKERKKRKPRGNYDDMRRCTLVVCLVVMTVLWQSMIKLTFDSDDGFRLGQKMLLRRTRKMPSEGEIGRPQLIDAFISNTPLYHLPSTSICVHAQIPRVPGRLGIDLGT